ncbi:hypothetical protein [Salipaludibacillus sp. CF4.18]|uniref:hypothetical protein n=1 Tax=Salipaludibacillus sp. CF4.18 TaxID=3373081 RepID=UPI003EE6BCDC
MTLYAVFSDYCDAGQTIYSNYDDAKRDYDERVSEEYSNGVDSYICKVVEVYKAIS